MFTASTEIASHSSTTYFYSLIFFGIRFSTLFLIICHILKHARCALDHCFSARLFRLTVSRVISSTLFGFCDGPILFIVFSVVPSFSSYSYCPCTSSTTLTFRFTNCISMTSQYKLLIILRYIDLWTRYSQRWKYFSDDFLAHFLGLS